MFKTSVLSAAVFAASVPALAVAQSSQASFDPASANSPLETLVVVASRTETPLRQLGSSVAVLDKQDLKNLGVQSLADALRTMPSVSITNAGGPGKASSVRVRGESGFRTLVRVDGVDITDPTGPQSSSQVHHLLTANVARVELLRGPQGMMYGADAGGVLNVTTDHINDGMQSGLSVEGGRYDTRNYSGYVGGGNEQGDFYLSAARADTEGFSARSDDPTGEADGYENTTLHARGGWNLDRDLRAQIVVRDTEGTSEFDNCGFPVATQDCVDQFEQTNARASITHRNQSGANTFAYSQTDVDRINYADGAVSYQTEGKIAKWELNGKVDLADSHTLVYGAEHRRDEVMDLEREQRGAYLEYQGAYQQQWFVTAGVRQDDNDDFGNHTSYRLSTAYRVPLSSGELKFKSALGTGFRAPSLSEIDYNRSQELPPPSLDAEESRGLDLGVEYFGRNGLHLEAVWFDQKIEDEIFFDMIAYSGYLQDGVTSESRGVELNSEVPLADQWQLVGNYTYVDTEAGDGNPRSLQPRHLANLGLRYSPVEALTVALDWRTSRDRQEGTTELDDYQVVNANVRYQVIDGMVVFVRAENLLDEDYVETLNYNTSGAAGYAGIEFTF